MVGKTASISVDSTEAKGYFQGNVISVRAKDRTIASIYQCDTRKTNKFAIRDVPDMNMVYDVVHTLASSSHPLQTTVGHLDFHEKNPSATVVLHGSRISPPLIKKIRIIFL